MRKNLRRLWRLNIILEFAVEREVVKTGPLRDTFRSSSLATRPYCVAMGKTLLPISMLLSVVEPFRFNHLVTAVVADGVVTDEFAFNDSIEYLGEPLLRRQVRCTYTLYVAYHGLV